MILIQRLADLIDEEHHSFGWINIQIALQVVLQCIGIIAVDFGFHQFLLLFEIIGTDAVEFYHRLTELGDIGHTMSDLRPLLTAILGFYDRQKIIIALLYEHIILQKSHPVVQQSERKQETAHRHKRQAMGIVHLG